MLVRIDATVAEVRQIVARMEREQARRLKSIDQKLEEIAKLEAVRRARRG